MPRHTLVFTTTHDIPAGHQLMVEMYTNEPDNEELVVDECAIATRSHPGAVWGPPTEGDQTS